MCNVFIFFNPYNGLMTQYDKFIAKGNHKATPHGKQETMELHVLMHQIHVAKEKQI
jgi:hypothetical protein